MNESILLINLLKYKQKYKSVWVLLFANKIIGVYSSQELAENQFKKHPDIKIKKVPFSYVPEELFLLIDYNFSKL